MSIAEHNPHARVDKTGHPISVGDFIVYGHALGRCAGLRFGKVLAIKERRGTYAHENGITLTVIGVDDDWSTFREPKLCNRKGSLMFPQSRVVVIPRERMPERFAALLDAYDEKTGAAT